MSYESPSSEQQFQTVGLNQGILNMLFCFNIISLSKHTHMYPDDTFPLLGHFGSTAVP